MNIDPLKVRYWFLFSLVVALSACGSWPTSFVSISPGEPVSAPTFSSPLTLLKEEPGGDTVKVRAIQHEEGAFEANQPVAARVNHQPIFLESYQKQVARLEQRLVTQGVDPNRESEQAALAQIKRQVLETLIDQLIIEQEAARLNIIISAPMVEAEALAVIAQAQNQNQFEAWLAVNSLNYDEFKAMLRIQLITNRVFETITHDELAPADKVVAFNSWLTRQRETALIERYVIL